jgi:hypothetical protein
MDEKSASELHSTEHFLSMAIKATALQTIDWLLKTASGFLCAGLKRPRLAHLREKQATPVRAQVPGRMAPEGKHTDMWSYQATIVLLQFGSLAK